MKLIDREQPPDGIDEVDLFDDCGHWFVTLSTLTDGGRSQSWRAQHECLPLAICAAALKARATAPKAP